MVLKAVILVGGYGTRLRPLTFSKPKPLVEFCNKSIVKHQIDALVEVGVQHVILCVSYRAEMLENELNSYAESLGIQISFSLEDTPMGTAGPLVLCKELLDMEDNDPFFMLNADVTCSYPFADLLDFHCAHGKEGTIFVTRVEDPSKYGVVVAQEDGQIDRFVEKPKVFVGDKINAGMYIFNKSIVNRIPNEPTSIERVIFPAMANEGELYRMVLPGFWMDIGQPKDYISGVGMKLDQLRSDAPELLAAGGEFVGNVMVGNNVTIGNGCKIGPNVVIGDNCVIEDGVRLQDTTLMSGCTIEQSANVSRSIIGWNSKVCKWARLQEVCVLGEDCVVKEGIFIRDTMVCPHKGVKANNFEDGKIILGL